jgi:hypothetical protein
VQIGGSWAFVAGLVASMIALAVLLPNVFDIGLWSKAEFPVLNRSRGAMGEPFEELVTSPWLPDFLRTQARILLGEALGPDAAIRLPHALASATLVGLAAGIVRRWGAGWWQTALTAVFALSFPIVVVGGSTLQGAPIAEVLTALAVVFGLGALNRRFSRPLALRIAYGLLALLALAGAVASCGLAFGLCLPLAVLALSRTRSQARQDLPNSPDLPESADVGRWPSWLLWAAAAAAAGAALYLAVGQEEGFIPMLGASKDLELVEHPQRRALTSSFREAGYLIFPWGALALMGLVSRNGPRWPGRWLVLSVAGAALWSQVYGFVAPPIALPAAIACGAVVAQLLDPRQAALLRRLVLAVIVIGTAVAAKDASQTPSKVASPLHNLEGEQHYPDAAIGAGDRLERMGRIAIAGLLLGYVVAPGSRRRRPNNPDADAPEVSDPLTDRVAGSPEWLERLLTRIRARTRRVPSELRAASAAAIVGATVFVCAAAQDRLVRESGRQLSARQPLDRHASWVADGRAPEILGVHRIRDEGVRYYGPPRSNVKLLTGRSDLSNWLVPKEGEAQTDETRVVLIRRSDFPFLYQKARQQKRHLETLDWDHRELVLVSNAPIEGVADIDPLADIVLDRPTQLENETLVRYGDYVELIGWEFEGPVRRGERVRVHLMFKVLRPLPTTSKIIARLQKGKMSRINVKPHIVAEGKYPANYWRKGDFIHHRQEFDISRLEALPGEHNFIVAVKKTEKGQIKITEPPEGEKKGSHGVKVPGKKHEFATVGTVWVE